MFNDVITVFQYGNILLTLMFYVVFFFAQHVALCSQHDVSYYLNVVYAHASPVTNASRFHTLFIPLTAHSVCLSIILFCCLEVITIYKASMRLPFNLVRT